MKKKMVGFPKVKGKDGLDGWRPWFLVYVPQLNEWGLYLSRCQWMESRGGPSPSQLVHHIKPPEERRR